MLKPYYQDEQAQIYLGDCVEILSMLERESADLVVTDPPYGVEWRSSLRTVMFDPIAGDDSTEVGEAALAATTKVLRAGRHAYVFGRFKFPPEFTEPVELIWDKGVMGSGNLDIPWGPAHEPIQFSVNIGLGTRKHSGTGPHGLRYAKTVRIRQGSVIRVQRLIGTQVANHPTEKPVELLRVLIETSSHFGETVLDPFMGSGSTLVAARLEGRKAIGIELKESYCETTVRRLRNTNVPMADLFSAITEGETA